MFLDCTLRGVVFYRYYSQFVVFESETRRPGEITAVGNDRFDRLLKISDSDLIRLLPYIDCISEPKMKSRAGITATDFVFEDRSVLSVPWTRCLLDGSSLSLTITVCFFFSASLRGLSGSGRTIARFDFIAFTGRSRRKFRR